MKGFILCLVFGLTACAPSYRQFNKGSATDSGPHTAPQVNSSAQPRVQEQGDTWAEPPQETPPTNTAPAEIAPPPPETGSGPTPKPQEPAQPVPPASPFPEENDPQWMDEGPVAPVPPPVSAPVEKRAPPPAVKLPRTPQPTPPTPPPSEPKPKPPVVREPVPEPSPEPPKPQAPASSYRPYPALWEKRHRDGVMWSAYLSQLISSKLAAKLLPGSKDIKTFCPRYHTLSADQRVNFWVVLTSAIAKPESDLDPTNRSREGGMGIDRVTGQRVYSEGLLQLSYQDSVGRSYCEFDWGHDRRLSARSPKKTILDPLKNLKCGIHILANQIQNQGRIATSSGVYWSVLVPGGRYSKIGQIRAVTRKIPFCG